MCMRHADKLWRNLSPVMGVAYTDVTSGQDVTGNRVAQKVGRSSAMGILGLVAIGVQATRLRQKMQVSHELAT